MSQLIQITDKTGRKIEDKPLDLAEVKAKLAASGGQTYWRSLEELAEQPGFTEMLRREFPGQAPKDWAPLPRRDFVKLMGAALALAGLSGCAFQPQEKIVPYVKAPEEITPGVPLFYATAMPFMGYALGVMAEAHEGRPTKVEGNPDHPITRGKSNAIMQASILNMYDPDRSQVIRQSGSSSNWDAFTGALAGQVQAARARGGQGFALVTETITSPTQLAMIAELKRALPGMTWVSYDPINRDNVREGARLAFGRADLHPLYHFDRAQRIVSLDCDFLLEEPGNVAHSREFISKRKLTEGQKTMNRLYTIESTPTITGAQADHRFPVKASEVDSIARALAQAVGVPGVTGTAPEGASKWIAEIANDLKSNRGSALVVAGAHQPAAVHALAFAITSYLGSVGPQGSISFHAPIEGNTAPHGTGLKNLVDAMNRGTVQSVVFMGTNPVYAAPSDLRIADGLKKVPFTAHIGPYEDETSALCTWHIPEAHYLETWGDIRAIDGTVSIIQPLIQPLYDSAKTPTEVLSAALSRPSDSNYDVVRSYWLAQRGGNDNLAFQKFWQTTVHNGVVPGTAAPVLGVTLGSLAELPAVTQPIKGMEVNFRPDPTIWDGRYANNPWLQECPKPYSKITWDNAVFVSPTTAHANNWNTNDEVTVTVNGKSVTGAIFMLPGQPDDTITLHLGYGRTTVGKIGTGTGFNANIVRSSASWFAGGVEVKPTGRVFKIATTSHHNIIAPKGKETTWQDKGWLYSDAAKTKLINNVIVPEGKETDIDGTHGRDLVRVGTFDDYLKGKLPTSEEDKKGVPLAYPKNPEKFRNIYVEGKAEGEGHGGGEGEHGKKAVPFQEDRELEGFPSFYPRETDYLAKDLYRDASVNAAAVAESKKLGRDDVTMQWGMTIDLQSCIGCNACVVGCQSENNTSTVGKDQVLMNREMHWMRIDTYYRGSYENPETYFEPMYCQHCEKAPCAPVCPFNAVMESPEGINEQIYNRCVGTKYCENNCPYKVRRFNFLQYADQQSPVIQLMSNPDVTVRSRGVMEKCTYCIQRVNAAKWQAEKEDRYVRDGEIVVACQQACPTDALVFGDINDPNSRVSKLKRGPLTFGILTEFDTMPRNSYLARFKNPNPALGAAYAPAKLGPEEHSEGHSEEAEHDVTHGGAKVPENAQHSASEGQAQH